MMKQKQMNKTKILFLSVIALFFANSIWAQEISNAVKLYEYKRYASAIKELEPMAATNSEANYYLGLCYIGLEDLDKAQGIFSKYADDPANISGKARILFEKDKATDAMALVQQVAGKSTRKNKFPLLYAADAITYTHGGNYNMAVEWYNTFKEEKGENAEVLIHLGDAYRKMQGGGGNAMTAYQKAADLGNPSISNYKQGNLWYAAKNYDSAKACYERATQYDENNPLPFYDLANAYYKINKYELAKQQIEKYLAKSDNAPEDQMQYANILYLSKDYDGAIKKMTELLHSGNGKSYMYRILGYCFLEKDNVAEALKNMDLLFAKHPANRILPDDYINYAKILSKTDNRKEEAMTYYEKGIAADTSADKSQLFRSLAESFVEQKDYAKGAIWYKRVTELKTPSVDILDFWWAGVCYYRIEDYKNSEDMFTKMTAERPDEPSGFYWLAKVAAAQDPEFNKGNASAAFKKYLEMVGDNQDKKNEIVNAYTYLAVVAYNTKSYTDAKTYSNKIMEFEADNATAKQILAGIPK